MKLALLFFAGLVLATGPGCIRSENQPAANDRVAAAAPGPSTPENAATPPASDSFKAGFPGEDIIRSTPLLAAEGALPPPGTIVALDDLSGWLAWRLAEVAVAEKRDNQLAMLSLQKEFNAQLAQVRGLRVRLAAPVKFVGEKDRSLIYRALREFGYPHAPLTVNDFVARFEEIQLTPWPTTNFTPTLYGTPEFCVTLQVTPFAEAIPPYRVRYANPSSTSLRGLSFLGNLFSPEQTLKFSKENPPVLEGRIHHLEYDADIPEEPDSSGIARRRLSLVLSNVRLMDQLPPHPFFLRSDSAPVEAVLALATAPPGNVFNEEANERFIRGGIYVIFMHLTACSFVRCEQKEMQTFIKCHFVEKTRRCIGGRRSCLIEKRHSNFHTIYLKMCVSFCFCVPIALQSTPNSLLHVQNNRNDC